MAEFLGLLEDLELCHLGNVGEVFQLHAVAQVGAVVAEPLHRVVVLEPGQRQCELLAAELAGHGGDQGLHGSHHILVFDERHLDVKLGKLGLAVGSQVFVAETAGDLEIAVEPGNHEELLVELRRLGQGVEMPRVHPARDQKVTRSLGRAPPQDRRLDLQEPMLAHDVAHELAEPVPENENPLQVGPAEIEEPVGQPQLLVGLGSVHLERGCRRGVVNDQVAGPHLDRARLELEVFLARQPGGDGPFDTDNVLVAKLTGARLKIRSGVRLEDDLGEAVAVAQVDEDQAAEIAPGVDPAVERNSLPDMILGQFAAGMSPFQKHGLAW